MKLIIRAITGLISLFGLGKAESVINRGVVMEDCLNWHFCFNNEVS